MGLTHSHSRSRPHWSNSFNDQNMDKKMSKFITTQTDVSFMLTKHVFSKEIKGDTNLVFSPLSIQIVLGLIVAGSKGPTKDQLLGFLKSKSIDELNSLYSHLINIVFVDGSPDGCPCLSVANGVWIDQTLPFKPSYKKVVDKVYKAASNSVDFQNKATEVANQVNQWAKTKTNDLIEEILPHGTVNNMARLICANALYFKGMWNDKFNASETKEHAFHLLRGGSITAPFMTSYKKQYAVAFCRSFPTTTSNIDTIKICKCEYSARNFILTPMNKYPFDKFHSQLHKREIAYGWVYDFLEITP